MSYRFDPVATARRSATIEIFLLTFRAIDNKHLHR